MIECTNCGAVGESYFSTNYFGELVCELCGTQSFLQSRNETQDVEDTTFDLTRVSSMRRQHKRKKNKRQRKDDRNQKKQRNATLLHCVQATQTILDVQAQTLVAKCGFPSDYPTIVQAIWFHFLEMWERKSSRPLLRCFTEFYLPRGQADKQLDPAITNQLLEEWDATIEQEKREEQDATKVEKDQEDSAEATEEANDQEAPAKKRKKYLELREKARELDHFSILDLLGILVLAGRVLNLGLLPCDYAHWVACGVLPFHNLLYLCPPTLQDAVSDVALFFESGIGGHKVSSARVTYHVEYLHYHLELQLPPYNASLIAYNICHALGFPSIVYRNFQWLGGFYSSAPKPELPLLLSSDQNPLDANHAMHSSAEIIAHLVVAIKLCPNWHEWIYEVRKPRDFHPPYSTQDAEQLVRSQLNAFVDFCDDVLVNADRSSVPPAFESHVHDLKTVFSQDREPLFGTTVEENRLCAYPAKYHHGVCIEQDADISKRIYQLQQSDSQEESAVYFYPMYAAQYRGQLHAALEHVLDMLCAYVDTPMSTVLPWIHKLDQVVRNRCQECMQHATGFDNVMKHHPNMAKSKN